MKTALAEERKQRLRELHLTKDNYRAYQGEIRVKVPVRGGVVVRVGKCWLRWSGVGETMDGCPSRMYYRL